MSETNHEELLNKLRQTKVFAKEGITYKKLVNPNGPETAKIIENRTEIHDLGTLALKAVREGIVELMTLRQLALLTELDINGPLGVKRLAADLNVNKPVIVRATDTLIKMGLVKRTKSVEDKREVFIELTPKGFEFRELLVKLSN